MSEGELLLRAILVDPADDAPRLIYADWLDEHGQSERAHFIRLSIQLCRREPSKDVFSIGLVHDVRTLQDISWSGINREFHEGALSISAWDRGFVSGIQCPAETFLTRARSLFQLQPITDVFLNDRQPLLECGFWGWTPEIERDPFGPPGHVPTHSIPSCLMFPYLHASRQEPFSHEGAFYLSPELALAALANACVAYGRRLAGLLSLPPLH